MASLCCLLCVLAIGCASTSTSTVREPLSVKLGQFKSATVEVTSTIPKPPGKLDEFMVQLESRIIAKLRAAKAFDKIYPSAASDSSSALRIMVVITRIRDVDAAARIMWGAFAGQANSQATIEFREGATGKLLGSSEIEGKSSGGSVFAGTTPEAVDRVADEVIRIVNQNQ